MRLLCDFDWTKIFAGSRVRIVKQRSLTLVAGAAFTASAIFMLARFHAGFPNLRPEDDSLIRVALAEKAAFKIYRQGSNAEGTEALLSVTQLLQKEEAHWRGGSNSRIYAMDLGLTYARLALLAEAAGATEKRNQYFDLARAWLAKNGRDPGTKQQIRTFVARVDESGDRGEASDSSTQTNAVH